jgi:transposase
MKAYSLDLRERVVNAYLEGEGSIEEIARQFNVGQTFVKKMLRQKRETGSVDPLPHGGGKKPSLKEKERRILTDKVKADADISLSELKEHLERKAKVSVSLSTIHRVLKSANLSMKKNR